MRPLVVKVQKTDGLYSTVDTFSRVVNFQREIAVQEVYITRLIDGSIDVRKSPKIYYAFKCLHCGKVEYHSPNGHIYPLCGMCANTQTIFETYFQLDDQQNDYELKTQFKRKIDSKAALQALHEAQKNDQ